MDLDRSFVIREGDLRILNPFDVAACLGATWIGGGVVGTIDILARTLRPGGMLLVGTVLAAGAAGPGDRRRLSRHRPGRRRRPAGLVRRVQAHG